MSRKVQTYRVMVILTIRGEIKLSNKTNSFNIITSWVVYYIFQYILALECVTKISEVTVVNLDSNFFLFTLFLTSKSWAIVFLTRNKLEMIILTISFPICGKVLGRACTDGVFKICIMKQVERLSNDIEYIPLQQMKRD